MKTADRENQKRYTNVVASRVYGTEGAEVEVAEGTLPLKVRSRSRNRNALHARKNFVEQLRMSALVEH